MTPPPDLAAHLAAALRHMVPPDLLVDCRAIEPGDASALLPAEARALTTTVPAARAASGAARRSARDLLARLGAAPGPILRTATGAPIWPDGYVGSLAHDEAIAVAVVGRRCDAAGLGIDVEPAEPLPADVADLVIRDGDRSTDLTDPLGSRLVFVAKEAVYKILNLLNLTNHLFL